MLSINTGNLSRLATSLMKGESNVIENLVQRKLDALGKRAITSLISNSPLGSGIGAVQMVSGLLSPTGRPGAPTATMLPGMLGSLAKTMLQEAQNYDRTAARLKSMPPWRRAGVSRSEWLNESWRHDWRSQPRNVIGRWIPGRLSHPVASYTRRQIRLRRIRRESRTAGRKWAKRAMAPMRMTMPLQPTSSWGRI